MPKTLLFREIVHDDIDELATAVADAVLGYRLFAPPDWEPSPASEQARVLQRWIADPDFWGERAGEQGTLAGHAACIPAAHSFRPASDTSLAHLGHLFVKPEYWGRASPPNYSRARGQPQQPAGLQACACSSRPGRRAPANSTSGRGS